MKPQIYIITLVGLLRSGNGLHFVPRTKSYLKISEAKYDDVVEIVKQECFAEFPVGIYVSHTTGITNVTETMQLLGVVIDETIWERL